MTTAQRLKLQKLGNAACLLWIVLVGWLMWATLPSATLENHDSTNLRDRMASECSGSYKDRYRCKEDLIIESGQEAFWVLSLRFLLVIVPPLIGSLKLSSYLRRHELDDLHRRNMHNAHQTQAPHHHDANWKARAHLHATEQSPEEAAQDLHLAEREWERSHHPHNADFRPRTEQSDWKSRAQHHVHQSKTDNEG